MAGQCGEDAVCRGIPGAGQDRGREQSARIITELLRVAMIEIRFVASQPESSQHPDGHLAHIRMLADVRHRPPAATAPRPVGEYDALVWTWQVADDFQR